MPADKTKADPQPETKPVAETPAATTTTTDTTLVVVKPADTALATAQPQTKYDRLPDKLRKVSDAMEGLCQVLYGDGFKHDNIWSNDSKIKDAELSKHLADLPLSLEIKSTLDSVKEGIKQVAPLKIAVDKIIEGMGMVVDVIKKGEVEVGKVQDMVQPVVALSEKVLPLVADAVKAATDHDIRDEVNASLDFIRGAEAVTRLGFFATGLLAALQKHMQAA